MDGTRQDHFRGGSLDRPAPMSVVLRDYPYVVVGLISGRYSVSTPGAVGPDGVRPVRVSLPASVEQQFVLSEADFEVCKKVAELFSQNKAGPGPVSAFKSEPSPDLRARIAARLRVEFAGRGA